MGRDGKDAIQVHIKMELHAYAKLREVCEKMGWNMTEAIENAVVSYASNMKEEEK